MASLQWRQLRSVGRPRLTRLSGVRWSSTVTGLLLLGRRSHIPGWLYALLFNRGVTPGTPRIFASWRRRARG